MIERGSGPRLAFEAFQGDGVARNFARQKLQRHKPIKPRVTRFVNDPHPSTADLGDYAVVGNRGRVREGFPGLFRLTVRLICKQSTGNLGRGRFDEVLRFAIELDEGLDLATKFVVARALFVEKGTTLSGFQFERPMKDFLRTSPLVRGHFAAVRSTRAAARL